MRRIHEIKKVYKNNLFIAIGINIIFLSCVLLFCDIKYEVSDDFVMASIMSGAYGGEFNPQLIFVNTVVGYILLPLYHLFPQVSWYLIFQLLLCFFAFVLVTYMLLERNGKPVGVLLSIFLITFFSDDVYVLPQFTKAAALVFMAGAVTFLWGTFVEKSLVIQIISAILCVLGSMVRFSGIFLMGSFILLIIFYEFVNFWHRKVGWKNYVYVFISGIVLITGIFGMRMLDSYTYHNDEQSEYFLKYNAIRSLIVDQKDYGYVAYEKELKKIDVSEVDYTMLKTWNFDDENYFTLEKMGQVASIIMQYNSKNKVSIEDAFQEIQNRKVMGYPVFLACLILLIVSVCINKKILWCFGMFGLGLALEMYFILSGRIVYRVEYGIFVGIFLGILYFWNSQTLHFLEEKTYMKKLIIILSVFFMIIQLPLYIPDYSYDKVTTEKRKDYIDSIFNVSWGFDARKYRSVVNKKEKKNGLLEEIENHKENMYFFDFTTAIQSLYYEWTPIENVPRGYNNNALYLGGIMTNLPCVDWILEQRGIESPIQSLVQEQVYLVDNAWLELKLDYLRQHYYPNARAELYKEIDGYQIWKLYAE